MKRRISDGDFAAMVKRDRTTVLRWRHGASFPDRNDLARIIAVTGGKVTPNDFLRIIGK